MDELEILDLNKNTINKFLNCFNLNNNPKDQKKVEWQFFENTEKSNVVNITYDSKKERTASIYAVSCIKFKINKDTLKAAQSLDTITDVNYRKQGLFVKSAMDVYYKAKNSENAFVYGFPNGNSIHGFNKKLKWKVLDPVPFLIKPLRTKYFFKRIPLLKYLPDFSLPTFNFKNNNDIILKTTNDFPDSVNSLWDTFSKSFKIGLVRDKDYLNWRYIQKPSEDYKIIHAYSNENKHLGYIVYTLKRKHNGKIGYIMELVYDLKSPNIGRQLLKKAISNLKNNKADCVLSWCFKHSAIYNIYKHAKFYNMPEKLRPIELHFGVLAFNKKHEDIINNRENWFLSYSDSDTV